MTSTLPLPSSLLKFAPPVPEGTYKVNEIFYSLQGEGVNVGTPMVFVRFSNCNLRCRWETQGFDCDTEFVSGRIHTATEIFEAARAIAPLASWLLFTGGEPGLQLTDALINEANERGYTCSVETNGTVELPAAMNEGPNWICVSPKTAEHTLRQRTASEVKYVRHYGMGIPEPAIRAEHHFISPAFQPDGSVRREDLDWCIKLVKENPKWRLSIQAHKLIMVR